VFEITAGQTVSIQGVTITGGHATSVPGGGGVLEDAGSGSLEVADLGTQPDRGQRVDPA
jgi:hypothetical protein